MEKYQISRVISTLEQQGIVEKNDKGVPSLTMQGRNYVLTFQKRVDMLVSFLLRAKLDAIYARDLALHIAGNANDEIIGTIENYENILKSKEALSRKFKFSGAHFATSVKNGSYKLASSVLYENDNGLMSFLNNVKASRMLLNVSLKNSTLQFFPENENLKVIMYFDSGEYIQVERVGDMFFIPIECIGFTHIGENGCFETSIGIINAKLKIIEAGEMVVRRGVIEIIF